MGVCCPDGGTGPWIPMLRMRMTALVEQYNEVAKKTLEADKARSILNK